MFAPQVADDGTYTCKVSNVAGQVDRTFRLTVHGTEATLLCLLVLFGHAQLMSHLDICTILQFLQSWKVHSGRP